MEQPREEQLQADLEPVQTHLRDWRAKRRQGSRMPEDLWREAVVLARKHGPIAIAKSLPVNFDRLKLRMERPEEPVAIEPIQVADFIELPPVRFNDSPEFQGPVVEVTETDGARMVIRLPGHGPLDLVGLVSAFRRGRA